MSNRLAGSLRWLTVLALVLVPRATAAQPYTIWYQDRPSGEFKIVDPAGQPVGAVPFVWPHNVQFVVASDRSVVYFAWGTNGWDHQVWRLDVASGATTYLFSSPWSHLNGFAPDEANRLLASGSAGKIWAYDPSTSALSIWQDNDLLPDQFGFDTFRYDLSFAAGGLALVQAGFAGAGGDAQFLADLCAPDATHHLCNLRTFSNPGAGSSSWGDTATNSRLDPLGRYAFYQTATTTAGHQFWRRHLATGVDTLVLPPALTDDLHSVRVHGDEVFFNVRMPSSSSRAIYACHMDTLACRIVIAGAIPDQFQIVEWADTTPPDVVCTPPDATWHGANVAVPCEASDAESGLSDPSDSAFTLLTGVAADTETSDGVTGSRTVCDVAGNCTAAGPYSGILVDRRAPTISIAAPAGGVVLLGQAVRADYACADSGSGVASCAGAVADGAQLPTSAAGPQTFTVTASDAAGNTSSSSVAYTVAYGVCLQYDPSKAQRSGSTVPIRIALCDAAGANVSSPAVVLTARGVYRTSTMAPGPLEDSGQANPDLNFRFADDRYVFNLSLGGFSTGTYVLTFTAGQDPTEHTVQFQVK